MTTLVFATGGRALTGVQVGPADVIATVSAAYRAYG
jgi:hypothetical protein